MESIINNIPGFFTSIAATMALGLLTYIYKLKRRSSRVELAKLAGIPLCGCTGVPKPMIHDPQRKEIIERPNQDSSTHYLTMYWYCTKCKKTFTQRNRI